MCSMPTLRAASTRVASSTETGTTSRPLSSCEPGYGLVCAVRSARQRCVPAVSATSIRSPSSVPFVGTTAAAVVRSGSSIQCDVCCQTVAGSCTCGSAPCELVGGVVVCAAFRLVWKVRASSWLRSNVATEW
ncbi:Uncharacterised protein [Mycobacteroides abscessus subsp. abscessus]|nr:Uncharacterised protein [Mycobacteroides abscessus subsp. abscessus]